MGRKKGPDGLGNTQYVRQLSGIHRSGKKKVQPWADLAVTYGIAVLSLNGGPPRNYETALGLFLNGDRAELRKSFRVLAAMEASKSSGIGKDYFSAIYDDPEQADAMFNIYQSRMNDE